VDAQPVATAVALHDPRRRDRTLYLALVRCVNDTPSLERLLSYLAEEVQASGCHRVIGPIGLSPHLDSGLLEDCWNETPPLHTSYNPPYLPELFKSVLRPLGASRLYQLEIPAELPPAPRAQAQLYPLEPARLAQDLLPVLAAACSAWLDFPSPDAEEAAFLLRWLGRWPLYGWLAQLDERPVGFVLLQPDAAPLLRRAHGARDLLWRLWLARCSCSRLRQGRVLYGGVLPEWQGQGVGRQLLHQALVTGHQLSWQRLRIGPLPDTAPAGAFLERHGARPRQTYRIYEGDL
jgi:GNAT superfamily N-acetyltransferase